VLEEGWQVGIFCRYRHVLSLRNLRRNYNFCGDLTTLLTIARKRDFFWHRRAMEQKLTMTK
jgi:hypothetical protein